MLPTRNITVLFRLWLPVIVWASLIFYLSSIPGLRSSSSYDLLLRKGAHIFEYLILTLLMHRAYTQTLPLSPVLSFVLPAVTTLVYAVSDETHQLFVPQRSGCARDVLIDALGILGFYILLRIFGLFQKKKTWSEAGSRSLRCEGPPPPRSTSPSSRSTGRRKASFPQEGCG